MFTLILGYIVLIIVLAYLTSLGWLGIYDWRIARLFKERDAKLLAIRNKNIRHQEFLAAQVKRLYGRYQERLVWLETNRQIFAAKIPFFQG